MSKPSGTTVEPLSYELDGGTGVDEASETLLGMAFEDDDEIAEETTGSGGSEPEPEDDEGEGGADEDEGADESEELEEDESEDEDHDPEPTYKVTVDGQEVEVTESELLAGYSRTADYTRKTQALAEQRKAVEAEARLIREVREAQAQRLAQIEEVLQGLQPAEPDWDRLRQENPAEFAAQYAEHQRSKEQMARIRAAREQAEREALALRQRELQSVIAGERQKLVEAIPEWKDPEVASKEKAKLADFARSLGYTDNDLAQVYDHRLMVILRKAAKYDEIQQRKDKVTERKVTPRQRKPLQPGTRRAGKRPAKGLKEAQRALSRLTKTGSVRDAAAALEYILDD